MERPSDLIRSVARALRILEVVGARPEGVAPKVVARDAGLHLSTTYHLLRTLAYEGWLIRDDTGDYALGLAISDRFADLCAALAGPADEGRVLRETTRCTSHSTYLARVVDGSITVTTVVEGPDSPHLEDLIPGFHEGAHATALGKALLSRMPVARRHGYLAERGLRPFTAATVTDLTVLDAELEGNDDGLFTEEAQFDARVACVARLVHRPDDPFGWAAVGIATSAASTPAERRRLALALGSATRALTASAQA